MSIFSLFPILCNYYITTRCNARCTFCNIYQESRHDCNTKDVFSNLRNLKKLGVRFIDFTGGEPLLHPDLPSMLHKAKQLGFITTVTTNCILYPRRANDLKGLIDLLHFSLDASTAHQHNSIRGVSCFSHVMESFSLAEKLGEKPDILFTVSDENIYELPEMIRMAQKRKLILLINPVFSYFHNLSASPQTLQIIFQAASQPYVYMNRGIIRLMKQGGNNLKHPRCRAVSTTVVISTSNHMLMPCYHQAVHRIPINNNLFKLRKKSEIRYFEKQQGRFSFCSGCTISCYFDPSFSYGLDDYFILSQLSKIKYIRYKLFH